MLRAQTCHFQALVRSPFPFKPLEITCVASAEHTWHYFWDEYTEEQLQHTSPQDYDPVHSKNFLWEQQAGVRTKTLNLVKTQRNSKGRSRHMSMWLGGRSLDSLDKEISSLKILVGALLDGSSWGQVLTERTFPLCDWLHKTLLQRKRRKKARFEQPSQFKQATLCLTGKEVVSKSRVHYQQQGASLPVLMLAEKREAKEHVSVYLKVIDSWGWKPRDGLVVKRSS